MTQSEALSIMKTGANVFLTGAPGAGKTHVLNQYVEYLRDHDVPVAITASTGIAATHVGGVTIHSWSGIGIRKKLSEKELDQLEQKQYLHKRFTRTQVLVIDEISMLDATVLDTLDQVCRRFRRDPSPFGGMQIIVVGDFFQLPPIARDGEQAIFAFHSRAWRESNLMVCYLNEQHRHEDHELLSLLDQIRLGDAIDQVGILEDRLNFEFDDTVQATKLFTHNQDVDLMNQRELEKLPDESEIFYMESSGRSNLVEKLTTSCLSPEHLELKIGATVMCTKNNFEEGYVNGTLGYIESFDQATEYPVIVTHSGKKITMTPATWEVNDGEKTLATITQIPLRLAWAITVHKSQGMSLDVAEIDLGRAFEYGQGYVALSRVRTLQGLRLTGFNSHALAIHPEVLKKDKSFRSRSETIREHLQQKSKKDMKSSHEAFIAKTGGSLKKIDWRKRAIEKSEKIPTIELTRRLIAQSKTIGEIAKERELTKETVLRHIEQNIEGRNLVSVDIEYLKPRGKKFDKIIETFQEIYDETGESHLSPIKNKLGANTSYFDIQLARLFIERN